MQTECIPGQLEFEGFDGRRVVAAFDGGAVTSDAGTVLLREADRAIGLIERVAACFTDHREAEQVVHALPTLIGQRIVAIALGYEDINDHDALRRDPVLALFSDQLEAKRKDCAVLAGKSTINRLEHAPREGGDRYHKIGLSTPIEFSREVPDEKSLVGRVSVISRRVDRGSYFSAAGRGGVAVGPLLG